MALELYQDHDIELGLKEPLYAVDSTTNDLCLSLFPWAEFRSTIAGIKAHTVIDLRGSIPAMLTITTGKVSDVGLLDHLTLPKGFIVVLDRGMWTSRGCTSLCSANVILWWVPRTT